MSFVSQDGLKAIAQYHLTLLKLQVQIEEFLNQESFDASALSAKENTVIRLIVKVAHDSLIATSTVLNSFIV